MHVISATNVNDAYRQGLTLCAQRALPQDSRNGPVRRCDQPVTTMYFRPTERVLLDPQRNANPFFHLFESLWMLAGRQDLGFLTQFLPSFSAFSDDGSTLHGAYGYRWRSWPITNRHGFHGTTDQLTTAIDLLRHNPADRRVVIGMWDPARDLDVESKDIPCNDLIKCAIVNGKLDLQVFCRSNDLVFGCYGANAVHMSMLQEYLASMIGVPVGIYYQISADFHAYVERPYQWATYWPMQTTDALFANPYGHRDGFGGPVDADPLTVFPLIANRVAFDRELRAVCDSIAIKRYDTAATERVQNPFFTVVAQPMYMAFRFMQTGTPESMMTAIRLLTAAHRIDGQRNDWLTAGLQWCERKLSRAQKRGPELDSVGEYRR